MTEYYLAMWRAANGSAVVRDFAALINRQPICERAQFDIFCYVIEKEYDDA